MEEQDIRELKRSKREQKWQEEVETILQSITGGNRCVVVQGKEKAARLFPDKVMNDLVLIGNALVGNTTAEELHLYKLRMDERATMALANGIRQSQVKRLRLNDLSFVEDTPGGRQRIASILCDSIRSSKILEGLTVSDMGESTLKFSDFIIKTNNTSLKAMKFDNMEIDDPDVNLLVESIHPNLPFECLSLSDNKIGPVGVQALLRAMAHHPTWNQLGPIHDRSIGFEGLKVIGEELQNMHQHGQPSIYVTTPKFISVIVSCCVEWNDFDEEEKETEAAMQQNCARKSAEQALLDGVRNNVFIVKLQLDCNHLSGDTLTKIEFYLQLNKMGRYLLGTNHGLASTIWCHVLAKGSQKKYPWWWSESKIRLDKQLASSVTFYLLREQPHLLASTW